jgi:uncharacterized membrane protein
MKNKKKISPERMLRKAIMLHAIALVICILNFILFLIFLVGMICSEKLGPFLIADGIMVLMLLLAVFVLSRMTAGMIAQIRLFHPAFPENKNLSLN